VGNKTPFLYGTLCQGFPQHEPSSHSFLLFIFLIMDERGHFFFLLLGMDLTGRYLDLASAFVGSQFSFVMGVVLYGTGSRCEEITTF
jgi:hypothetical protein